MRAAGLQPRGCKHDRLARRSARAAPLDYIAAQSSLASRMRWRLSRLVARSHAVRYLPQSVATASAVVPIGTRIIGHCGASPPGEDPVAERRAVCRPREAPAAAQGPPSQPRPCADSATVGSGEPPRPQLDPRAAGCVNGRDLPNRGPERAVRGRCSAPISGCGGLAHART